MEKRVVDMNETELENVAGGFPFPPVPTSEPTITVHKGCGGTIIRHLFSENECDRCGEHHYWIWEFDRETIPVNQ